MEINSSLTQNEYFMRSIHLLFFVIALGVQASAQQKNSSSIKPLTPQEVSERLLPAFRPLAFGPITTVSHEQIIEQRKMQNANPTPVLTNADSLEVSAVELPGLYATDPAIPVRIYKAKHLDKAPIMIWMHGGGFVSGNLNWEHQRCANLALRAGVVVISVDYRLAPENPFPAGMNDCYASLLWASKHAAEIGGDSARIGIGGSSAGAGLAGSVAQMARDKKGPRLGLQILEIPPADLDTTRRSVREFYNIPGVKGADIPVLLKFYLGKAYGKNPLPDYVLPGLAKDVSRLPPTLVITAGVDPLRDGGLAYALRLIEAGVPTELHNYSGYAHGMPLPGETEEIYRIIQQYLK